MKRLTGYVLVKETNAGVPNLVVAAYDSESPTSAAASVPERQVPTIGRQGKRIGSVLTGCDGKFVLTAEDLEFQGNESRPDLLLMVFAPEDVQSPDWPYPLVPEKRILYISAASITDAGAEEVFVIRLLQAQLLRFGIPAACASPGVSESSRYATIAEDSWAFRDGLRQALGPRFRQEQQKADARRKDALEKTKSLSAIPLYLRDGVLRSTKFLIKDRDDLKASLQQRQSDAIEDGLKRLARTTPTLRLTLTQADLTDLGLANDGTGNVDAAKLAQKVRALTRGVDLVRVRGLNNPAPEILERMYLSDTASDGTGAKTPGVS